MDEDDFAAGFSQSTETPGDAAKTPPATDLPADKPLEPAPGAAEKPAAKPEDDPAALRQQIADALHRERSSANRISAFATENNALKRRLEALETAAAAATKAAAAPAPPADDPNDVLNGAPDLKAAVESRLQRATAPLQAKLDELTGRLGEVDERATKAAAEVQPLRERNDAAEAAQVGQALEAEFPGWVAEIKGAGFQQWLTEQSPEIQALYQNGTTVRQAGAVLKLYRADTGALVKTPPAGGNNDAAKARLRTAGGIPSKPSTAKVDDSDDFSAGFRLVVKA